MYIAFKENVETMYWLDLLAASEYLTKEQYDSIQLDCIELKRILSSITKSMGDEE